MLDYQDPAVPGSHLRKNNQFRVDLGLGDLDVFLLQPPFQFHHPCSPKETLEFSTRGDQFMEETQAHMEEIHTFCSTIQCNQKRTVPQRGLCCKLQLYSILQATILCCKREQPHNEDSVATILQATGLKGRMKIEITKHT